MFLLKYSDMYLKDKIITQVSDLKKEILYTIIKVSGLEKEILYTIINPDNVI